MQVKLLIAAGVNTFKGWIKTLMYSQHTNNKQLCESSGYGHHVVILIWHVFVLFHLLLFYGDEQALSQMLNFHLKLWFLVCSSSSSTFSLFTISHVHLPSSSSHTVLRHWHQPSAPVLSELLYSDFIRSRKHKCEKFVWPNVNENESILLIQKSVT